MKYFLAASLFLVFFAACDREKPAPKKNVLARVGNSYLYYSDIAGLTSGQLSAADSQRVVKSYIKSWIRQQLLIDAAKANLDFDKLNIQRQIEDYKNSLIIYLYEQELIQQKMDTFLSTEAIQNYYEENKSAYELNYDIAKVRYLVLKVESPKMDSVKQWIQETNEESRAKLQEYSYQYALNSMLNYDQWINAENLIEQLPVEINKASFFTDETLQQIEKGDYLYLVYVEQFAPQGAIAPLSYVEDNIRKILLNKRKVHFLEEVYNNIRQKAYDSKKVEEFVK